jgi:hypothetical protein
LANKQARKQAETEVGMVADVVPPEEGIAKAPAVKKVAIKVKTPLKLSPKKVAAQAPAAEEIAAPVAVAETGSDLSIQDQIQ